MNKTWIICLYAVYWAHRIFMIPKHMKQFLTKISLSVFSHEISESARWYSCYLQVIYLNGYGIFKVYILLPLIELYRSKIKDLMKCKTLIVYSTDLEDSSGLSVLFMKVKCKVSLWKHITLTKQLVYKCLVLISSLIKSNLIFT